MSTLDYYNNRMFLPWVPNCKKILCGEYNVYLRPIYLSSGLSLENSFINNIIRSCELNCIAMLEIIPLFDTSK